MPKQISGKTSSYFLSIPLSAPVFFESLKCQVASRDLCQKCGWPNPWTQKWRIPLQPKRCQVSKTSVLPCFTPFQPLNVSSVGVVGHADLHTAVGTATPFHLRTHSPFHILRDIKEINNTSMSLARNTPRPYSPHALWFGIFWYLYILGCPPSQ